jgi:hypothetical protein
MDKLLATVNALRAVPPAPWRSTVRRVAVILTSSRSGSTLFKEALARHPGIAALDGEMEPLLALSGNGFGHDPACASDAIAGLQNPNALADNVFDGLTVAAPELAPQTELHARWTRRLLLQFPALFAAPEEYARLQRALGEALAYVCARGVEPTQRNAVQTRTLAHRLLRRPLWPGRSAALCRSGQDRGTAVCATRPMAAALQRGRCGGQGLAVQNAF